MRRHSFGPRPVGSVLALFALSCLSTGCGGGASEGSDGSSVPGGALAQGAPAFGDPARELADVALSEMNSDELQAEYARIQMRLAPLQQQALQDPALQKEFSSLEEAVTAKMDEQDPNIPSHRTRLKDIGLEFEAAQATEDAAKMEALREEGGKIQEKLRQAQIRALETEDVFADMEAFQENVVQRMSEIDPGAEDLIERASQIVERLRTEEPMEASPDGP